MSSVLLLLLLLQPPQLLLGTQVSRGARGGKTPPAGRASYTRTPDPGSLGAARGAGHPWLSGNTWDSAAPAVALPGLSGDPMGPWGWEGGGARRGPLTVG